MSSAKPTLMTLPPEVRELILREVLEIRPRQYERILQDCDSGDKSVVFQPPTNVDMTHQTPYKPRSLVTIPILNAQVLRVNKQLLHESNSLLYRRNVFNANCGQSNDGPTAVGLLGRFYRPSILSNIRHLNVLAKNYCRSLDFLGTQAWVRVERFRSPLESYTHSFSSLESLQVDMGPHPSLLYSCRRLYHILSANVRNEHI